MSCCRSALESRHKWLRVDRVGRSRRNRPPTTSTGLVRTKHKSLSFDRREGLDWDSRIVSRHSVCSTARPSNQPIQWTHHHARPTVEHMGVDHRGLHIRMGVGVVNRHTPRQALKPGRRINHASAHTSLKRVWPVLLVGAAAAAEAALKAVIETIAGASYQHRAGLSKPRPKRDKPHKYLTQKAC